MSFPAVVFLRWPRGTPRSSGPDCEPLLRCWASPRTIETPLKALSAHGTGTNEKSESADDNMGILVVEFHGVALVDRVLVEAFFQPGKELCIYPNFVWQINEKIKNIALTKYELLSA